MSNIHAIAIDAEFSSFDMLGGDLISFGMCEILEGLTLGRSFSTEMKPRSPKYFTDKAEAVHEISYFKASQFQSQRDSMIDVLNWLTPLMSQFPLRTVYWGGWNFDLKWLLTTMERNGLKSSFDKAFHINKDEHISGLKMAKEKLAQLPDHKLNTVTDHYNLDHDHHDVISNAIVTAQSYCKIMKGDDTWTGKIL